MSYPNNQQPTSLTQPLCSADIVLSLAALQRDLRISHLQFVAACKHFPKFDPLVRGWQDTLDGFINSCIELLGEVTAHAIYEEAEKLMTTKSQSAKK